MVLAFPSLSLSSFLNTEPPPELMRQIFPWIEQEQAALDARSVANPNARDFALKHFLALLKWLRRVLLQDAAVLSSSHSCDSSLPFKFLAFAPFNTATFQTFASSSAAVIHQAAEEARLQLQNLPDQYAHAFRGLVTSATLEQQRISALQSHQIMELTQNVQRLTDLLNMQSASKKPRHRRTGNKGLSGFLSFPFFPFLFSLAHGDASLLASGMVTPLAPSPFLSESEPAAAGPVLPEAPLPGGSSSDILVGSAPPLGSVEPVWPSPVPMPTMAAVPALPPPNPGTLPPPLLSLDPHVSSLQHSNWNDLVKRYGEQRLRRHPTWTWEGQGFMPYYVFQPVNSIREIWEEWSRGLNGFLSTRELEEHWGARWRRNTSGLKTENGRRKKVVGLIDELTKKPNWNVALALRFLQDRYGAAYKTPRKFCEFLQAKSNMGYHQVIAAASEYIP